MPGMPHPLHDRPAIGPYCPDLGCESHVGKDERDLEAIDQFEVRRWQGIRRYAGRSIAQVEVLCLADCKRTEAIWRVIKR
jgi:hypothetical protein